MPNAPEKRLSWLRLQLTESSLRQLRARAAGCGVSESAYGQMIFHYLLHDRKNIHRQTTVTQVVYYPVEISESTRRRLLSWSDQERCNLADFAGQLIDFFLGQTEEDPRDLSIISEVSSLVEDKSEISYADLVHALQRSRKPSAAHLPPGYLARWIYSRIKPLVREIEIEGCRIELSAQLVEQMLAKMTLP